MSCKCSGTEQINWFRQLLLLVRVCIVNRCLCIASISNKMPVWNNCQEAVGLGVSSVAYQEKPVSDGHENPKSLI